ncbi:MAG: 50S ribosomal protein L17 [Puniceicoccales bacterium]|jgi:large subunit ribosomal protein L17|nr:50S ribosomal protein L17 [Puniceicoccales bacterium]
MRHRKHRFQLGVKKEHRASMMASLAAALFRNERIQTTLARAKALRPFAEKLVTLSCKAMRAEDAAKRLHFRRLAVARMRDHEAVKKLFDDQASEFVSRPGGYTRIYKLVPRRGDATPMALIEIIKKDDRGYRRRPRHHRRNVPTEEKMVMQATPAAAQKEMAELQESNVVSSQS